MAAPAPRAVVYSTEPCGNCARAKAILARRGIPFREEILPRTADGRERLARIDPRARTFPLIVIDGIVIGGYRELLALDAAEKLGEPGRERGDRS